MKVNVVWDDINYQEKLTEILAKPKKNRSNFKLKTKWFNEYKVLCTHFEFGLKYRNKQTNSHAYKPYAHRHSNPSSRYT